VISRRAIVRNSLPMKRHTWKIVTAAVGDDPTIWRHRSFPKARVSSSRFDSYPETRRDSGIAYDDSGGAESHADRMEFTIRARNIVARIHAEQPAA